MRRSNLRKSQAGQSQYPGRSRVIERRALSLREEIHEDPVYFEDLTFCQHCNKDTHCIIQKNGGNKAWVFCGLLSLCGGLCMLPFLCDMCLDIEISCLECKHLKKVISPEWFRWSYYHYNLLFIRVNWRILTIKWYNSQSNNIKHKKIKGFRTFWLLI